MSKAPRYKITRLETVFATGDVETVHFLAHAGSGQKAVGILTLEVDEPAAFVRSLFVEDAHRGKGIGSMLLEAAFSRARKVCKESVGLWLNDDNAAAQRLYRKHGFVKYMAGAAGHTQYIKIL